MTKRFKKIKLSTATNAYDLLNDVCTAVLDEPRRLDMGVWFKKVLSKPFRPISGRLVPGRRTYVSAPACGTVGCIAGWMRVLTVPRFEPGENRSVEDVADPARRMLCDNTSGEMHDHIDALFHGKRFDFTTSRTLAPYPFPNHRVGTRAYAQGVVDNIRKFQHRFAAELRARTIA